jgi:excisionase family DNA binding protein
MCNSGRLIIARLKREATNPAQPRRASSGHNSGEWQIVGAELMAILTATAQICSMRGAYEFRHVNCVEKGIVHQWASKESREVVRQMKTDNSRVMTVKELSDYLKVHPSTVYRQLKRGQLPAFKVGSDWRFNVESIDRWRLEQDSFGEIGENS